jgi:AcrR family transcriptional regulator
MSIQSRRERERAERERLIITTARELAEAEGWQAVTTRRLADQIEYSQPVLYSHFAGKTAIMQAVATDGFAALAAQLHSARTTAAGPWKGLVAVAEAYSGFAGQQPAVYDAMFTHPVELPFASPGAPAELQTTFDELRQALLPFTAGDDLDTLAETLWGGLHGLIVLQRSGRLRTQQDQQRLILLLKRFVS